MCIKREYRSKTNNAKEKNPLGCKRNLYIKIGTNVC